tara:strand:+ start:1616 stop:1999 length:384 start_codon:yes stop_codon:yes gene_type:complete
MKIEYPESEEEFKKLHTSKFEKYILVFSAQWCDPCQKLKPGLVNYVNMVNNEKTLLVYLDADIFEDFMMDLGVVKIPTFIVYNGYDNLFNENKKKLELHIIKEIELVKKLFSENDICDLELDFEEDF